MFTLMSEFTDSSDSHLKQDHCINMIPWGNEGIDFVNMELSIMFLFVFRQNTDSDSFKMHEDNEVMQ